MGYNNKQNLLFFFLFLFGTVSIQNTPWIIVQGHLLLLLLAIRGQSLGFHSTDFNRFLLGSILFIQIVVRVDNRTFRPELALEE